MNAPKVVQLKLADLEFAAYNPRTIDAPSYQGLRDSLTAYGMLEVPVVNVFGGNRRIISGHQRVRGLLDEGVTDADCIVVEFDDTKERMANVAMNNPAIQGEWDAQKALPSMASIMADLPKPDMAGFQQLQEQIRKEADRAQRLVNHPPEARDKTPPPSPKPHSKEGRIYQLGKHKLYAGDTLKGIPKLLSGARAHACVTDPPYNVGFKNFKDYTNFPDRRKDIEGDNIPPEEFAKFCNAFCKVILKLTDGPCYLFSGFREMSTLRDAWEVNRGIVHRWLVWAKDSLGFGFGEYRHQCEIVLYGYREGLTPPAPKKSRTNVIEFPRPTLNPLHTTQKPVGLVKMLVEDACEDGQTVIDPFGGSGTTLVVCEELGRVCLTCEIDLIYCDTIRKRWAEQVHAEGCDWKKLTPALQRA